MIRYFPFLVIIIIFNSLQAQQTDRVVFKDSTLEKLVRECAGKPEGELFRSDVDTIIALPKPRPRHCRMSLVDQDELEKALKEFDEQNPSAKSSIQGIIKRQAVYTNLALKSMPPPITDISGIENLVNLKSLDLPSNNIRDISALKNLKKLEFLTLSNNNISDISSMKKLKHISWLDLNTNQVKDISPLVDNSRLGEGDSVFLLDNPLNERSITKYILILKERGVEAVY